MSKSDDALRLIRAGELSEHPELVRHLGEDPVLAADILRLAITGSGWDESHDISNDEAALALAGMADAQTARRVEDAYPGLKKAFEETEAGSRSAIHEPGARPRRWPVWALVAAAAAAVLFIWLRAPNGDARRDGRLPLGPDSDGVLARGGPDATGQMGVLGGLVLVGEVECRPVAHANPRPCPWHPDDNELLINYRAEGGTGRYVGLVFVEDGQARVLKTDGQVMVRRPDTAITQPPSSLCAAGYCPIYQGRLKAGPGLHTIRLVFSEAPIDEAALLSATPADDNEVQRVLRFQLEVDP